jgi:hypothetical protein
MHAWLLLASVLSSDEMTFPNECVVTVTSQDSVSSWGGYNLDKPKLDTMRISKTTPPDRYVFKKENELAWGARFIYRNWIPMDYCDKLGKEILPAQAFSNEDAALPGKDRTIEIIRRDAKKSESVFTVKGIDGNYLYLRRAADGKVFCVSRWFSAAIYSVLADETEQMEFDIRNKADELIRKFKAKN